MNALSCFKAYDVRGRIPSELNNEIAYRIGRAYAAYVRPRRVVVGRDVRVSSEELCEALTNGLRDSGVDVLDIGLCGTEEVYFSCFHGGLDGGVMVTASHNPMDYNGMKFVREHSKPISGDSGLREISIMAAAGEFADATQRGQYNSSTDKSEYIDHLMSYIDVDALKPLKLVVNAGNGGAGEVVDLLEKVLPFEFVKIYHEPDGRFPNGIPNPLLPENRGVTSDAVKEHGADLGIAWDGDFDRCFFFDEKGGFVEGYYIVGLLAQAFLHRHPGERVVHDPRLTWNTIAIVEQNGGVPVQSKTGHAFMKERMRLEGAIYGGEMSAHHYFRDFAYCDSGMIPWLLVAELLSHSGQPFSELVDERKQAFPCSGELNFKVQDVAQVLAAIESHFEGLGPQIDRTDGLSMEFENWRFNLRSSNTEPLLRLNVESRGDEVEMHARTKLLTNLITA